MSESEIRAVLTITESDTSGGAGMQADLRTFAAFGVYGVSAVTAIRAGDGDHSLFHLPSELIAAQIDAVASDVGISAVKTGELPSAESMCTAAERIRKHGFEHLVVDPVIPASVAGNSSRGELVEALVGELLPIASVVTPNIPEAEILSGIPIRNPLSVKAAAKKIQQMGPKSVLITGGRQEGPESIDVLFDGTEYMDFPSERALTTTTGAGTAMAAAIAAGFAHGRPVAEAVAVAKMYVTEALARGFHTGRGASSLNHLYAWWDAGGANGWGS